MRRMGMAEMLQEYGGWGVSAVCLTVIWRMGAYIAKLHENQRKADAAAVEATREDVRVMVTALIETRDTLRAFKEAMEALARKLAKGG